MAGKEEQITDGASISKEGKRLGEIAEVLFSLEVLRRGGRACIPLGDSAAFDMVVASSTGAHRVQIKSCWLPVMCRRGRNPNRCRASIGRCLSTKTAYGKADMDLMAIWLEPFKRWVFLTAREIRGRKSLHITRRQADGMEVRGWKLLGLAK